MSKKVKFSRPRKKPTPDEWVTHRTVTAETPTMKRLTLDLPEALHKELKIRAAREETTMADIVRKLIEKGL